MLTYGNFTYGSTYAGTVTVDPWDRWDDALAAGTERAQVAPRAFELAGEGSFALQPYSLTIAVAAGVTLSGDRRVIAGLIGLGAVETDLPARS